MNSKKRTTFLLIWLAVIALIVVGIVLLSPPAEKEETIQEVMKDAVLHDLNKVSFFGLEVNPSFASDWVIMGILITAAVLIRILVIPKFTEIPGKFQLVLEMLVGYFMDLGKKHSPHRNYFLCGYLTFAGCYIFFGTMFELLGVQWITTEGHSISLPAPLSDINCAIAMGLTSYGVILFGGLIGNGLRGLGSALKEFSLPISMSFRLFGALLSGLLVTELVYYSMFLSIILPIFVGVMFTMLHALIQTYVLTMLVATFYGEVNEKKKGEAQVSTAAKVLAKV